MNINKFEIFKISFYWLFQSLIISKKNYIKFELSFPTISLRFQMLLIVISMELMLRNLGLYSFFLKFSILNRVVKIFGLNNELRESYKKERI